MEDYPPLLAPLDPRQPYAQRMMLIRRYWHLTLKFSSPIISESGRHEATWVGGAAIADTAAELMAKVLEAMGDCGGEGHLWTSQSEMRDPRNSDNVLFTERLKCAFCADRERVITIYHPHPTVTEQADSGGPGGATGIPTAGSAPRDRPGHRDSFSNVIKRQRRRGRRSPGG